MGGEVEVRAADDIRTVAVLFREYAGSLGVDLSYQGFEAELAGLPGAYAAPAGVLLVAYAPDGEALGCVAFRPPDNSDFDMKRLHTRPAPQGAGARRALAVAGNRGRSGSRYPTMRLDTLPGMRAAQALYRSPGFKKPPACYDTAVPGTLFMRKGLTAT